MLITDYPDIVRREGLLVEVVAGFASRSHGEFKNTPKIVWHHDASPPGPSPGVLAWMVSNWDTASANIWVDYYGKWWFVGAGVAWHAGATLPTMPTNQTSIGIETDYTAEETISWKLYDSLRRGTAAIMRAMKQPDDDLHFHKTICKPVGRKSDPWGLTLSVERDAVGAIKRGGNSPLPLPDPNAPVGPGGADPKTPEEIEEEELMAAIDQVAKMFSDLQTNFARELQAIRHEANLAAEANAKNFSDVQANLANEIQALRVAVGELKAA